jgi:hypothetical protein
MKAQRGSKVQIYYFFNLGASWAVDGQRHVPAALPLERDPVPTLQQAG